MKTRLNITVEVSLIRLAKSESINLSQLMEKAIKDELSHKYDFNDGYEVKLAERELEDLQVQLKQKTETMKQLQKDHAEKEKRKQNIKEAKVKEEHKIRLQLTKYLTKKSSDSNTKHLEEFAHSWVQIYNEASGDTMTLPTYRGWIKELEERIRIENKEGCR